ncbi:MAG: thiamine transport system ATP-binding protein [Paracoccaceae bacterium]|jgi:thiamine transport system ATP-binding protein
MAEPGLELRLHSLRDRDFALTGGFSVPRGAMMALIGPSGGGKSTALDIIAGFVDADAEVRIDGRDVSALPPAARPASMLFQEHNLFPHLTTLENVALGADPSWRPNRAARAKAEDALEAVGLGGLGARHPAALSGGQRSRAALARALIRARPVLLLDEPFAALGPGMRRDMLALVRSLQARAGTTVVLVTHDPDEARAADLAAVAADGQITEATGSATLFADPPPALRAWLGG